MATYKGIDVAPSIRPFIAHMPLVDTYREALQSLQGTWDTLNLLGQLSGTTAEMSNTREAFAQLTGELLSQLAERMLARRRQEMAAKAQVVIDILVRNLFERTADIGFLATDGEVRRAAGGQSTPEGLRQRFYDYVRKYSVYDDVMLLNLHGEVLASLGDHAPGTSTQAESWFADAKSAKTPYTEYFGPSVLFPERPVSLIYACRVCSERGQPLGVLALSFRFTDEMTQIFAKLEAEDSALVLALLDDRNRVIASSDVWQLPLGASVAVTTGQLQTVRFAGRSYLAETHVAHPYQGYPGPGWRGLAMLPIDQAFTAEDEDERTFSPALLSAIRNSERAFPAALRNIPGKAEAIQRNLGRSVWNGTVHSSAAQSTLNPAFSKILLREISRTGSRMREVFSTSIGKLQTTVLSSQLDDLAFIADLAIDIMDRNLYERANDCRWWAMDPAIAEGVGQNDPAAQAEEIGQVLAYINDLYTVYTRLVVFDTQGRVLALSNPDDTTRWQGQAIDAPWVKACLDLPDPQAYAVSAFAPSPFYNNAPTYIYSAAIRAPRSNALLGGIGIVFDAGRQFRTMLQDVLPSDANGRIIDGYSAVFIDAEQRVLASSDDQWPIGQSFPLALETLETVNGRGSGLLEWDGRIFTLGLGRSSGYREYKGPDDAYRNDVRAVVLFALGEAKSDRAMDERRTRRELSAMRREAGGAQLEVATFTLGDHWLGLPVCDVIEAIELGNAARLANAPTEIYGAQMYRNRSLPLYNLHNALGVIPDRPAETMQVVVVKGGDDQPFGILVDTLQEVAEVPVADIADVSKVYIGITQVLAAIVKMPEPGQPMLTLLSAASMAASLRR